MLSKLNFGLSTGYGGSNFTHDLDHFGIIQQPDSIPVLFDIEDPTIRYSNWTNTVSPYIYTPVEEAFQVSSDTARLGFTSKTFSIPLKATVHIELLDRFRIGAGYSYGYTRIGTFQPVTYADRISSYTPAVSSVSLQHYFLMLGARIYRYYEYAFAVDVNMGYYVLGKRFNRGLIRRRPYFNLGFTAERQITEYLRVFVRPSFERKSFDLLVAETPEQILGKNPVITPIDDEAYPGPSRTIRHHLDALYLNFGIIYRLPELRRCFIKTCHAQVNHIHGNREYRSRMHPFYKKQNPHYGENYPTLIRYKGKNKRKLSPY